MKKNYFRVRLSQVPSSCEDILTTYCFDHQATGVTEVLSFSQPDLTYDPHVIEKRFIEMDVFFEAQPAAAFIENLASISPQISHQTFEEEEKDWLEEWKKGFQAFKLVGPYWIVPSWIEKPEACEKPIYIDPGMAFGTGTHATTQMMAHFIHKLSQQHSAELANWALLDVGTGTAILAMLAQQSGFGIVTGIEIDPEARRTARENVKLNKLEVIDIPESQLEEIRDKYDVVVANIIDGVLLQLKKDLIRVVRPGGYLLLTGILTERDNLFFEKFIEESQLKVIRRLEKDEWVGYWVQIPEEQSQ
ncbi:MAG: 50S ribosomal protein L11 methyltransferase [Bdellovibrionia bacterium]